jgi:outer membrane protein TolC
MGRLLPSVTARGILQYNQYPVSITIPNVGSATITPEYQADAIFQLDVPLIDVASMYRYGQSKHIKEAAAAQQELVGTTVDLNVTRGYYNFLGASALVAATEQSIALAQKNVDHVRSRLEAGAATELDLTRAAANLERSRQDLADAEYNRSVAARTLETLTGMTATPVEGFPVDDLAPEAPFEKWTENKDTPQDKVQKHLYEAAVSAQNAAKSALLPTLSANAQERLTNATGFAGRVSTYTLQAVLTWRLDYASYATARAQSAAQEVQKINSEGSRRNLEDNFFEAFKRVEASITKSRSARAQVKAADRAAELAQARYQAGALTQLEVTQAQRDAFQSHAAQIQADSTLLFARASLRILAGLDPENPRSTAPLAGPTAPEPDRVPTPATAAAPATQWHRAASGTSARVPTPATAAAPATNTTP